MAKQSFSRNTDPGHKPDTSAGQKMSGFLLTGTFYTLLNFSGNLIIGTKPDSSIGYIA